MSDYIDELTFVHHCTERTFAHTLAAEYALVIVDTFVTGFVLRNRADRACFFARHRNFNDSMIWTVLHAQTAVYALVFVDRCMTVDGDCFFRTVDHARPRKASLARIRHHIMGAHA